MRVAFLLLFARAVLTMAACNPVPVVPPPPAQHAASMAWASPLISARSGTMFVSFPPRAQSSAVVTSYTISRAPCLAFVSGSSAITGSCSSEGSFAQIGSTTATAYTDAAVSAAQSYSWFVTAIFSDGTSVNSNHIAALIPGAMAKASPAIPAGRVGP